MTSFFVHSSCNSWHINFQRDLAYSWYVFPWTEKCLFSRYEKIRLSLDCTGPGQSSARMQTRSSSQPSTSSCHCQSLVSAVPAGLPPGLDLGIWEIRTLPRVIPPWAHGSVRFIARKTLCITSAHCNSVTSEQPTGSECNFLIELC